MIVAVPKEVRSDECRVALVPAIVSRLVDAGFDIRVEAGAGEGAYFSDSDYEEAGAHIVADTATLLAEADVVLKVMPPETHEVDMIRAEALLISLLKPFSHPATIQRLAHRKITAFSMELIPRITRAQSMDVLSSQSAVAGYKAVLLGASALGKFFPMLTTAAGTLKPATVFVIGAGVAGLQAIATARRLGALVEAFDIRPSSEEEVKSLGAKFVKVELEEDTQTAGGYAKEVSEEAKKREQAVLKEHVRQADVVITTALVPGRKAPVLVTEEMVAGMHPGSVIVDLAAEQGGNCELTRADEEVLVHGVKVLGVVNLPATMPGHASQMYAKNVSTLLQHLAHEGAIRLDFEDEITSKTCVTHDGVIRNDRVRQSLEQE